MADAGSIWFEALSGVGKNIGRAIQQTQQRNQQWQTMDAFIKQGSQFNIPDASGKMQPLVSPKVLEEWTHENRSQQMKNMGALEALQGVYENLALAGAKARMSSERLTPIFNTEGQQIGERGPKGGSKFFPEWVVRGPKSSQSPYLKQLAKHGLEPNDLQGIEDFEDVGGKKQSRLKYLDSEGEELGPVTPTEKEAKQVQKSGQPIKTDLERDAKFVAGTTKTGKPFKIPKDQWRDLMNMRSNYESDRRIAPGARQIPVVKTAAEAFKLGPGALFKTPDGRYKRVPYTQPNGG